MVPSSGRILRALLLGMLVVCVFRGTAAAIEIVCADPATQAGAATANARLVGCTAPGGTCNVVSDFTVPAGCTIDFGNRDVVFKGTFDVGSTFLTATARSFTVQGGSLKARSDTNLRGGVITLTANGDGTATHPGDIVVATGRVDVTGNSAGIIKLTAAGKIDLQSTTPLVANGNQITADGGVISLIAGSFIRQGGNVSATGGNQAGGGSILYRAGTNISISQDLDAFGGVNDGGDVELDAGDDVSIAHPIDVSSINGGNGGSITVRAGFDALTPPNTPGGVKVGGALTISATLNGDGGSDVDSGYDGADIILSAFGPITLSGAIHATGGVPDGSGGSLSVDSSDGQPNVIGPLDGNLSLTGAVSFSSAGNDSSGGDVDIVAGRNATIAAPIDISGADAGSLSVVASGDASISSAPVASATQAGGDGGSINFRAGDATFGTLTIGANIDGHAGTAGAAQDHTYAGCNVTVQPNLGVNANGSAQFGGSRIDLAAPGTLTIGGSSQFIASPSGMVVLTHANPPVVGSGVVFTPTRIDNPAAASTLYPACPVCGDGIRQLGEVCDKGAGADGACCNANCSALVCATPTPTPTVTATSTAPTLMPTPTRTATPTFTPPPAPTRTATPTVTPPPTVTVPPTATATPTGGTPSGGGSGTPTATPTAVLPLVQAKPVLACENALGRAATALVTADITTIERCSLDTFTCIQTKAAGPGQDACIAAAQTHCAAKMLTLDKARSKFTQTLASTCGGTPPRVPLALMLAPSVLAFEEVQPSCQQDVGLTLTSLGAIAGCVQATGACRAERALAIAVPRIGDLLSPLIPVVDSGLCVPPPAGDLAGLGDPAEAKLAVRCQKGTSAAGRKLLLQRLVTARQCVDGLLKCRLSGRGDSVCAKIAARCEIRLTALTSGPSSATAKLAVSVDRACGALAPTTLLGADGVGFDAIAARCTALGVSPIGDASAVASCVARAFGCAATSIVRHALPLVDDELGRFGIVLDGDPFCAEGPTSTPSPSPSATVTAEVTATPVATVTVTAEVTATPVATATVTAEVTATPIATATVTAEVTATPAPTPTVTVTASPSPTATPTASITPSVTPTAPPTPGCGNGIVEPGEQCDFADTVDGDGCSHDCQFELLVPGSGPAGVDCGAEWAVVNPHNDPPLGPDGLPSIVQTCVDGDASCDADGIVNDECRFRIAVCFSVADPRLPDCVAAGGLAKYTLQIPRPMSTPARNPTRAANAAALLQAFEKLSPTPPGGRGGNVFTFDPPLAPAAPDNCTEVTEFVVQLGSDTQQTERVRAVAESAPPPNRTFGLRDHDTLRLTCVRP